MRKAKALVRLCLCAASSEPSLLVDTLSTNCWFEHTELSIHLESFNDRCALVKEAQDAYLLSQESKLTRVNLQLNWCPSKSTVLKRIPFQYLELKTIMDFLGHTKSWSDYDMQ